MDPGILKYNIELFLLGGPFDLFENGQLLASIEPSHTAVEVTYGKTILSSWTEEWSRSWRVLKCTLQGQRMRLDCTKDLGRTACLLTLSRGLKPTGIAKSRTEFSKSISRLVEAELAPLKVLHAAIGPLNQRNLSAVHTRLLLRDHRSTIAGIAVSEQEGQPAIDSALAAGLVWLDDLRERTPAIDNLMLFAPRGRAATLSTRLCAVKPALARITLFEVDEAERSIEPVSRFDQGDLMDRLRKASHRAGRRANWPVDRRIDPEAQALINSITILAPDEIESHQRGSVVLLTIRGLEFARVSTVRKRVEFGLGDSRTVLNQANRRELVDLVDAIVDRRRAESQPGDMFYRAQAERWLESIILRDVTAIDSTLDREHVYSQVPAYRGEQRSYIDLLTVTRRGRLVVIELKVSEDPDFPLQGLDYWLRVEWHRRRGDFQRRGYFAGVVIADRPPLLYLVAPVFRFHATTALLAGSITEQAPVYRIGINADWRRGVRILLREKLN